MKRGSRVNSRRIIRDVKARDVNINLSGSSATLLVALCLILALVAVAGWKSEVWSAMGSLASLAR